MTDKPQVTLADIAWLRDCLKAAQRQGLHSVQRKFERLITVCEQSPALQDKNARLREAVSALCRVMGPINMTLAERECIGKPLPREAVILSFMGSGASDNVTVGEFEDAMALARQTLTKEN